MITWLHLSSAKRSRILNRCLPRPDSLLASVRGISCCLFHSGQFLKRCSTCSDTIHT